jgi:hypothetical protein
MALSFSGAALVSPIWLPRSSTKLPDHPEFFVGNYRKQLIHRNISVKRRKPPKRLGPLVAP